MLVDGFNMDLAKGSGIATYGRNLAQALDTLGHEVSLLHGPQGAVGNDPLLDEIATVDGARNGKKMSARERAVHTWAAQWRLRASWAERSGRIEHRGVYGDRTRPSGAWVSRDAFYTANRCFDKYGRFAKLQFRSADAVRRPRVAHWTSTLPIQAPDCVNIYTIHDLIPLKLPYSTLERKSKYLDLVQGIARRADHIIAVSETTRRDIIELLGVPEGRVTNTYQTANLVDSGRSDAECARQIEDGFGVSWKGYFLHYGAVEPKKNLGRIVDAYIRSGTTMPLIVVGASGWSDEPETALLNAIQAYGAAANRVRRFDYLPAEVLADLVRGARATIFPSLYEGFGLPVLESMMSGTAVLTSDRGSLPEIAGSAALLVDPESPDDIAKALKFLASDDGLVAELEAAGRLRSQFFSPEKYRDRLTTLYTELGL